MNKRTINEKIRLAYDHAAPEILEEVLSDCGKPGGGVIVLPPRSRAWTRVAGMAACLCLILGAVFGALGYRMNHAVDSTVSLDVNPSVEIQVNQKERVLQVVPLNEDGRIILDGMDFSGSDLNVAVNALIGSMLRNGYLNELANSILISVDNKDPARGTEIQERLTAEVNKLLQTDTFSGAVLSQTVSRSGELERLAREHGITVGKAQLIEELRAEGSLHSFDELASLSINELNLLLRAENTPTARVEVVGVASDRAYIGETRAKEIALERAEVSADSVSRCRIEMDTHRGAMVYEVDFLSGSYEYECEIDALTGQIVSFEKEFRGARPETGPIREEEAPPSAVPTADAILPTDAVTPAAAVSAEQARDIAFAHAKVAADSVSGFRCELDRENGALVYELEFRSGGYEYDYEISADTGAVLKHEKEWDP